MTRIIEVGPRDGLQNEPTPVPTALKADFVFRLAEAGLKEIEVTSFVSPARVPQLSDAAELLPLLTDGPLYSVLVPNLKGLERALESKVSRIAVFTAASETFTQRNIGMSIEESLAAFKTVADGFRARVPDGWVRGYLSMAFECPFEGKIDPSHVAAIANRLFEIGVDEVSLGDTIGVAGPQEVRRLSSKLPEGKEKYAWHFHDTHGTAIANVAAALELGYAAFDASAGGLGGCPFAPGAGGNLATEDLVYFLERSGVATGVDLQRLAAASLPVLESLGRRPASKSQLALLSVCG